MARPATGGAVGGELHFGVPREVAFDYLVDPRNRPQWQSSLRRVSSVAGDVGVGQTWVDETKPGLRPRMRTTLFERPALWSETGRWGFVRANLTLSFTDAPPGCTVSYGFRIHALGPLGLAVSALSARAVRADLERAARIVGR